MKILYGYKNVKGELRDPIVAIGVFDGIHLGHKRIIRKVLGLRERGRDKVVMTFDPHPQTVLRPEKTPPRIMSLDHRLLILEKMGIDAAVVIRFTDFIAMMRPEDFVKRVILGIGARKVYVGSNFHFGRAKSGDAEAFRKIGGRLGVEVNIVPPVKQNRKVISSTWVRKLVTAGRIEKAEKLLRRPVSVLGTVVKGAERGRSFGLPTANVDPHQEVIPPPGVYAVKVDIDGTLYDGVLNIGFRPTFYGRGARRKEPHIEAHVLEYDGDLYGKTVEIFFIKRLRRERRFRHEEALARQIRKDVGKARKLLTSRKILLKIRKYKYI